MSIPNIQRPRFGKPSDARATTEAIAAWIAAHPEGVPDSFDPVNDIDLLDAIDLVIAAANTQLAAKADLSGGKIPLSQIPDGALERYLGPVASQSAMLALSAQQGDYCLRSDRSSIWYLTGTDPTVLGNWLEAPVGISQAVADARYARLERLRRAFPQFVAQPLPVNASRYGSNPVLGTSGSGFDAGSVRDAAVFHARNKLWMVYTGASSASTPYNPTIGIASSLDNGITWIKHGQILAGVGSGAWNSGGVFSPGVFFDDLTDELYVYVSGVSAPANWYSGPIKIGVLKCAAGADWTNPASYVYQNGGSFVLEKDQSWEGSQGVYSCSVKQLGSKYVMLYSSSNGSSWWAVGRATADSPSGPWVKDSANPVMGDTSGGRVEEPDLLVLPGATSGEINGPLIAFTDDLSSAPSGGSYGVGIWQCSTPDGLGSWTKIGQLLSTGAQTFDGAALGSSSACFLPDGRIIIVYNGKAAAESTDRRTIGIAYANIKMAASATLDNTGVTPGTYGSATKVGQFQVGADGRISFAAEVNISGAGSTVGGWGAEVNDALTALTGLNTGPGTWSVSSGQVQTIAGSGAAARAVFNNQLDGNVGFITEAEVEIPASFSGTPQIGIYLSSNSTATGPTSGNQGHTFTIRPAQLVVDQDAVSGGTPIGYSVPAAGTWVKMRILVWLQTAYFYVDGVLKTSANLTTYSNYLWYGGLFAYNGATVRFRNGKTWSLLLP